MAEILREKVEVPRGLLWLFGGVTPVSVLIAVFVSASWKSNIDSRVEKNTYDIETHKVDYRVHYDYYSTSKDFMPRPEIELQLKSINEKLDELLEKKK